jgi:hypothetical protein
MTEFWRELVVAALRGLGQKLSAILPGLLALATLVGLGAVLGLVARTIVARLSRAFDFDARCRTWGIAPGLERAGIARAPSDLLGLLAFWSVFAVFAAMGIDALALPGAPRTTEMLVTVLPRFVAGALIVVIGWLAANFVGQAVLIAAVNTGIAEARILARAARWGVLLFAIATALTHVGIGRDMVMLAFAITFGGLVLALALAFGLGGRGLAREILERRLRRPREPHPSETITHL